MISHTPALNINPVLSSTAEALFDLVHDHPFFLQHCPTCHPADTTTHFISDCFSLASQWNLKHFLQDHSLSWGRRPWFVSMCISPCAGACVVEVFVVASWHWCGLLHSLAVTFVTYRYDTYRHVHGQYYLHCRGCYCLFVFGCFVCLFLVVGGQS